MPSGPLALLPRATIPGLVGWVDGYLAEDHQVNVRTLTYPVEEGADITDHAVRDPIEIELTGYVSDLIILEDSVEKNKGIRASSAWEQILQMADERMETNVVTMLGEYENMILTSASASISNQTGRGLEFTIRLKEIRFADQIDRELLIVPTPSGPGNDRTEDTDQGRPTTTASAGDPYNGSTVG